MKLIFYFIIEIILKNKNEFYLISYSLTMTKNTIGGKKFKKGKKQSTIIVRNFPKISDYDNNIDNFFYSKVINVLGGKNVLVLDLKNNKEVIGAICGSMYKKEWLKKDDVLLCSKRPELGGDKCDIIFKYTNDEVKILKRNSEIEYHENIKNDLINNIFSKDDTSEETEEISNVPVQQPYLDPDEDFGDSDIDDI